MRILVKQEIFTVALQGIRELVSGALLVSYSPVVQFLIDLKRINGLFSMLKFRATPTVSLPCFSFKMLFFFQRVVNASSAANRIASES